MSNHLQRLMPDPSEPSGSLTYERGLTPGPLERGEEERRDLLSLAPPGRILELSGRARTSLAARLVAAVQAQGDPVGWVTTRGSGLYPPDLVEAGIDLSALVVVRVPSPVRGTARGSPGERRAADAGPKAAELLLRTGAFGAVVLDVPESSSEEGGLHRSWLLRRKSEGSYTQKTTAWQGRLSGILRAHEARLILLTEGDSSCPSLGPLVSVRLELLREPLEKSAHGNQLAVTPNVLKDKSGSLRGWNRVSETYRGPAGLRFFRPPAGSTTSTPRSPIRLFRSR